ncbi:MAG: hypothetical protein NVS2B12_34980 [Ktedonobacteraceae bacterium]
MQQMVKPQTQQAQPGGASQVQSMIITAIILFALSGLMVGFTVGAFTHPRPVPQAHKDTKVPVLMVSKAPTPTQQASTADIATVRIGCPIPGDYKAVQVSDGTTDYTFSAQIVDKSLDNGSACGKGKPLAAVDLSCKMWLVKEQDDIRKLADHINKLPADQRQAMWNLQQPFPKEVTNALVMDAGSMPAMTCNSTGGATTWHYKLSPQIAPGTYYIAILANWHGGYSNWTWVPLTIAKS